MIERRILNAVDAQDRVERATLALVGEFDALDVVRRSARLLGDREHLLGRDVDEFRPRIDEAPDHPGTGDAVDLRALAGDPFAGRRPYGSARREALLHPAGNAAFEIDRVHARRAQS